MMAAASDIMDELKSAPPLPGVRLSQIAVEKLMRGWNLKLHHSLYIFAAKAGVNAAEWVTSGVSFEKHEAFIVFKSMDEIDQEISKE